MSPLERHAMTKKDKSQCPSIFYILQNTVHFPMTTEEEGSTSSNVETSSSVCLEDQLPHEDTTAISKNSDDSSIAEFRRKSNSKEKSSSRSSIPPRKNYSPLVSVRILLPVSICMGLTTLFAVQIATKSNYNGSKGQMGFETGNNVWNVMGEHKGQSTGDTILKAVVNALIPISFIIVSTLIMLLLYKCGCIKILYGIIVFSLIFGQTVLFIFISQRFFEKINSSPSIVLILFIGFNWALLLSISVLYKGPLLLSQIVSVTIGFTSASMLVYIVPDWTTWVLLGFLVIWDLFAVLAPCGPLRQMVDVAQKRDDVTTGPLSVMMYNSGPIRSKASTIENHEEALTKSNSNGTGSTMDEVHDETVETRGVSLGLGDFVFYSVLLSKAALLGSLTTMIACYLSIISGLVATLALLGYLKFPLPALPISLTLGMLTFFSFEYTTTPFLTRLAKMHLVF